MAEAVLGSHGGIVQGGIEEPRGWGFCSPGGGERNDTGGGDGEASTTTNSPELACGSGGDVEMIPAATERPSSIPSAGR